jgi:predicted dehydrogenase
LEAERIGPEGRVHRFGVIGAGRFAQLYHLPAILEHPRAELAMICDPNPSPTTRDLAASRAIPLTSDLDALLAPDVCDAVVISTPDRLHAPQVRAALDAGKHVLVDKPFVMESAVARELATVASDRGLVGAVAFNQRFSNAYRFAQDLVRRGQLGALRRVETIQLGGDWVISSDGSAPRQVGPVRPAWYQDPAFAGGGVLVGRGAHMADIVPWITGRSPARLRAEVLPGRPGEVDRGGTADLDFGDFVWRFEVLADKAPLWDDVRIYGFEGRIVVQKPEGTLGYWSVTHEDIQGKPLSSVPDPGIDSVAVDDFIAAMEGEHEPRCSFADAYPSVAILEAMFRSGEQDGGWVSIPA